MLGAKQLTTSSVFHGELVVEGTDEGLLIRLNITNDESEKVIINLEPSLQEVVLHFSRPSLASKSISIELPSLNKLQNTLGGRIPRTSVRKRGQ